jgi:hypothetical protein
MINIGKEFNGQMHAERVQTKRLRTQDRSFHPIELGNFGSVPKDQEPTINFQWWSYKLQPGLARKRKLHKSPYN